MAEGRVGVIQDREEGEEDEKIAETTYTALILRQGHAACSSKRSGTRVEGATEADGGV
jgi:hypothetical protein